MKAEIQQYLNRSLLEDLANRLNTGDVVSWLDDVAQDLSNIGRRANGAVAITKKLLATRNIARVQPRANMVKAAYIIPGPEGYEIYYNQQIDEYPWPTASMHRRFVVAHEIGHTLWFKPDGKCEPLSDRQTTRFGDMTIEYLCDRFAAALLLPRGALQEYLQGRDACKGQPLLHLVPGLARHFGLWEQAAARRLVHEVAGLNMAVVCARRDEDQEAKDERWKVSWCAVPLHVRIAGMVKGFAIPFKTSSRIIPSDMLPEEPSDGIGVTRTCILDMRWKYGCTPQREGRKKGRASGPLRLLSARDDMRGFAYREGGRLYVAVPL